MTSAADHQDERPADATDPDGTDHAPTDPVTGTTGNATGDEQAAENEDRDPVG